MHHILDCYAVWPKINQPYIWSDSENRTVPSPDVNDKGAHYELMINLKEKQLKELIEAIRKAWKDAIASGYVTKENADKCNDPKTMMKITKLDDKTYNVACKQKNYDAYSKPKQFGADRQPLADDFELTTESHIHIAVQFYFYQKGKGLHIQPKKIRVVELAARQTPAMVDDFEAEAAPVADNADPFDAPKETVTFGDQQVEVETASKTASDDFDDEIPF